VTVSPSSTPGEPTVVAGIDAGGSSTRARATSGQLVVHDGTGGPGNPATVDAGTLTRSYQAALRRCPPTSRIVACVAGAGSERGRLQVAGLLAELCPSAEVIVLPDYVGAWYALPDGTDVCVLAGTGSIVCSPAPNGGFRVGGGRGWILGDHGSAARLGLAVLSRYVHDDQPDPELRHEIAAVLGTDDPSKLVRLVHSTPAPGAVLASVAPILTRRAGDAERWARVALRAEMDRLAATTAAHAAAAGRRPRVGLAGGIWNSAVAIDVFAGMLRRRAPRLLLDPDPVTEPVVGAVRLATRPAEARRVAAGHCAEPVLGLGVEHVQRRAD
jgi:N-acetylglucosamine kinase-like BadF-type ATPase